MKISKRIALTRGALDHHLRTLPLLVLYPHSRCNCRCVMCDIWRANAVEREISMPEIERHRDSLRRLAVREAVLSGGEPLMHSNLFRFCRSLREDGIRITLVTTGLLLEEYAGQVAGCCAQVVVSLDGPEKIHDRIRGRSGAFSLLARGISALKQAGSAVAVTGRCTVQRLNYEQLAGTVDAAWQLGLAHISFLAVDTGSPAFNRPQGWPPERVLQVAVPKEGLPRLRESIEELLTRRQLLIRNRFVSQSPAQLRRLGDYFAAIHGLGAFPPQRCHAPWMSAVVDSEGNVLPCFFHPAYGPLEGRTMEEVLNSGSAVAFRRNLDVITDPVCRRCVCSIRHGGILDRISGGRLL